MNFANLLEEKIKNLQKKRQKLEEALTLMEDLPKKLSHKIIVKSHLNISDYHSYQRMFLASNKLRRLGFCRNLPFK